MNYFYHVKQDKYLSVKVESFGKHETLRYYEVDLENVELKRYKTTYDLPLEFAGAMMDGEIRKLSQSEEAKLRLLFGYNDV